MGGYYEEILEDLKDLMQRGRYMEAKTVVDRELAMPYIPADFEKEIRKIGKDIAFALSDKRERRVDDMDTLLHKLYGKPETQMSAVYQLSKMNLRECTVEIQAWFSHLPAPFPEAVALMIESLAEQEVGEEFTIEKNGTEFTFWGDSVTPCAESEGYREALSLLVEWLGADHPDILQMCRQLLSHQVYMFLPLSYEEGEGEYLALDILRQISEMMDDGALYAEITSKLTGNRSN